MMLVGSDKVSEGAEAYPRGLIHPSCRHIFLLTKPFADGNMDALGGLVDPQRASKMLYPDRECPIVGHPVHLGVIVVRRHIR